MLSYVYAIVYRIFLEIRMPLWVCHSIQYKQNADLRFMTNITLSTMHSCTFISNVLRALITAKTEAIGASFVIRF